jgi:hemerythrin-like metal-binding protein
LEAFVQRFILRREVAAVVPPLADGSATEAAAPVLDKTIRWKCGVPRLDEQYEALFKVIRQFQRDLKEGAKPDVMKETLAALEHHVEGHLAEEEAYLEFIHFPDMAAHRLGHQAFRHQIGALQQRILAGDPSAGLELSRLLFTWMRLHVLKEDSLWNEFAKSRHQPAGQIRA